MLNFGWGRGYQDSGKLFPWQPLFGLGSKFIFYCVKLVPRNIISIDGPGKVSIFVIEKINLRNTAL